MIKIALGFRPTLIAAVAVRTGAECADGSEPGVGLVLGAIQSGRTSERTSCQGFNRSLIGRLIVLEASRQGKGTTMTLFALSTFADIVPIEIHTADSIRANLIAKREIAGRRRVSFLQTMSAAAVSLLVGAVFLAFIVLAAPCAMAQPAPSAPPAVGVVKVERRPMTDSYEFNGRVQAINSVNIVARVTALLDKQLFVEGTDVKKGDLLYTLERPPYQAAVRRPEGGGRAGRGAARERQYRALACAAARAEKRRYPAGR